MSIIILLVFVSFDEYFSQSFLQYDYVEHVVNMTYYQKISSFYLKKKEKKANEKKKTNVIRRDYVLHASKQ
jgi:hypothetical protein